MITNKTNPICKMISGRFFTKCKSVLASLLLYLFNLSVFTGYFPSNWKISFVLTIIRKQNNITNEICDRPVSFIFIIAKMFKSTVSKHIYPLLAPKANVDQRGFLKEKSTITNLLIFLNIYVGCWFVRLSSYQNVIHTDFS